MSRMIYSTARVKVFPLPADALYNFNGGVVMNESLFETMHKVRRLATKMKHTERFLFELVY